MSSRILTAYFIDFRKGKKNRQEILDYLLAEVQKDPLRFGHLMSALEQAQHDHPIPVTDFLLLRKEVQEAVNDNDKTCFVAQPVSARSNEPESPAPENPAPEIADAESDDKTLLAANTESANPPSPEANPTDETLVASNHSSAESTALGAKHTNLDSNPNSNPNNSTNTSPADTQDIDREAETLMGTQEDEITIVPGETKPYIEQETLSGSQHSDGVREVELPTIITQQTGAITSHAEPIDGAHSSRAPLIPIWGWLSGAFIVLGIGVVIWSQQPIAPQPLANTGSVESENTPVYFPADEPEPAESDIADTVLATDNLTQENRATHTATHSLASHTQANPNPAITQVEEPKPHWDADQWLEKIKQRADQGYLLPENDSHSAYTLLDQLAQRYPESHQILEAKRYLKNAYLSGSEQARKNGDWDQSQQYLDAAFHILKPSDLKPSKQISSSADSVAE